MIFRPSILLVLLISFSSFSADRTGCIDLWGIRAAVSLTKNTSGKSMNRDRTHMEYGLYKDLKDFEAVLDKAYALDIELFNELEEYFNKRIIELNIRYAHVRLALPLRELEYRMAFPLIRRIFKDDESYLEYFRQVKILSDEKQWLKEVIIGFRDYAQRLVEFKEERSL